MSNQPTPTNLPVLHLIVRKPFDDISGFVHYISTSTSGYLCGQHDADEDIETTHTHIMLVGYKYTDESLRKERVKAGIAGSVSILLKKQIKTKKPYTESYLGIYILKGDMKNYKQGSYQQEVLDDWVSKWVHRKPDVKDDTKPATNWEMLQEIDKRCSKRVAIYGDGTAYDAAVDQTPANFHIMCQVLNENKVKASIHELERWWVTLLRLHRDGQMSLYDKISSKLSI